MKVEYLIIERVKVLTGERKGHVSSHLVEWVNTLDKVMDLWERGNYENATKREFDFHYSAHTVTYYELVEFVTIETEEDQDRTMSWKFPRINVLNNYGFKILIRHSKSYKDYQGNEIKPWEVTA